MRTLWIGIIMAIFAMCVLPASAMVERIQPMYMDAAHLVELLWGPQQSSDQDDPVPHFAADLVSDALGRMPGSQERWVRGTMARQLSSGGSSETGLGFMVPEGIEDRPVVVRTQNAMLVEGTPIAIDRLREIIAMVDRPVDMVNVDVRSVDTPTEETSGWGIDWLYDLGDVEAGSGENRPGGGLDVRYGRGNFRAGLNIFDRSSRADHVMGANVLTHNNSPAMVVFGQTMPFVTTDVQYDRYGYRRTIDQAVNTVFLGIEVWALPRINGDGTVTVRVRPNISEWAGEVAPPGPGTPIPIVRTQGVETTVTVRDGESIVIGGMDRSIDEVNERFRGLFGQIRHRMSSHPTLILTPTIVRHRQIHRGSNIP